MNYPPNSRYHTTLTVHLELTDGSRVAYLVRRFVPPPERFVKLQEHVVVEGDRLDNLAARYLGDPEQFWRICDANRAMFPDALTAAIGGKLDITLPEGIPGAPLA